MIYFVEGTLASGKTTAAEKLYRQCVARGEHTVFHYEHTRDNPLDFTSRVFFSEDEYCVFEKKINTLYQAHYGKDYEYGQQKLANSLEPFCEGRILHVPSLMCNDPQVNCYLQTLNKFQLCNGTLPAEQYRRLLSVRWKTFAEGIDPSVNYIFEGALLQNPLLDMIGWYQLSDAALAAFYRELLKPFEHLPICVLFITVGKKEDALRKAGQERQSSDPPWIENLISWVEFSPFGRHQHLTGLTGAAAFCEILETRGLTILDTCKIPYRLLERR